MQAWIIGNRWSINRWFSSFFFSHSCSDCSLFSIIGSHPALSRCFCKMVDAMVCQTSSILLDKPDWWPRIVGSVMFCCASRWVLSSICRQCLAQRFVRPCLVCESWVRARPCSSQGRRTWLLLLLKGESICWRSISCLTPTNVGWADTFHAWGNVHILSAERSENILYKRENN